MIYGSMKHSYSGKRRKTNAWTSRKKQHKFVPIDRSMVIETPRRGDTSHIPSHVDTGHSTGRVCAPVYTGQLVKGISTMHKSNAVPVINEQEMKDHARMRR